MNTETDSPRNDYLMLSAAYDLLGNLWLQEVTRDRLNALATPELKEAILSMGGAIPDPVTDEVVQALAEDFCQLFIGPQGHCPPVQSVCQAGQFQADPAASCQRYYSMLSDFHLADEITDHLGVQLSFIAELFQHAAESEQADHYEALCEQFFEDHLTWTSEFLTRVQNQAQTDFYRGLARMTSSFLNELPESEED